MEKFWDFYIYNRLSWSLQGCDAVWTDEWFLRSVWCHVWNQTPKYTAPHPRTPKSSTSNRLADIRHLITPQTGNSVKLTVLEDCCASGMYRVKVNLNLTWIWSASFSYTMRKLTSCQCFIINCPDKLWHLRILQHFAKHTPQATLHTRLHLMFITTRNKTVFWHTLLRSKKVYNRHGIRPTPLLVLTLPRRWLHQNTVWPHFHPKTSLAVFE